jgi:hypothetical protein
MIIEVTLKQIFDFLSLVIIACCHAYVCREFYREGYREGKDVIK